MKKITIAISVFLLSFSVAFAHVVVRPNQVGVAAFQTFTVGVPVEKDVATVGLRLVIPEGLTYVSPNVKPGWKINIKKGGAEHDAPVTEIEWTGGNIPAGQRDDFLFSARVPAEESTLDWKAYQMYVDGTTVAWDKSKDEQPKDSSGKDDFSKFGPYSETRVVDDLSETGNKSQDKTVLTISLVALALSVVSLNKTRKQKQDGN